MYVPRRWHKTSTYYQRYLLSGLVKVHEVYTGTERGVLTIQEYVLNQVLTYVLRKQVPQYRMYVCTVYKVRTVELLNKTT